MGTREVAVDNKHIIQIIQFATRQYECIGHDWNRRSVQIRELSIFSAVYFINCS